MIKVATFVVAMTTVAGFASCSNDENINDEIRKVFQMTGFMSLFEIA